VASTPPFDPASTSDVVESGSHGGRLATVFSALALSFSGFSFYESVVKSADLEMHVPPVIHYARDAGGDIELFAIPITIVNEGARTGTVLSMELTVEDPKENKTKRYYSAYLGEHPRNSDAINRAFAPLSIAGKGTFTETVRFYPAGNPLPKLVDDAGTFRFTLKLETAKPSSPDIFDRMWQIEPTPLHFEMTLPWISEQQLGFRRAAIAMHQKDYKPVGPSNASPSGQ